MKSLTAMQAASWVGRQSPVALGGVAAHLYAEFDGAITDVPRLTQAVDALFRRHPMLRLQVSAEGEPQIADKATSLTVDDLQTTPAAHIPALLAQKRQRMETQQLLLEQGRPCEISLTLLPNQSSRLHIDLDMIAGDAQSFRLLVEELALRYHAPDTPVDVDTHVQQTHHDDPTLQARREQDRNWWRAQLATLPPAPAIPHLDGECRSERMARMLTCEQSLALRRCARRHHLTLSALFLAVFTLAIAEGFKQRRFRLNVPTFFRDPEIAGSETLIGDFTDLLLFSAELNADESLLDTCHRTMQQLHERLSHGSYSGVNVMRDLSRHHGTLQYSPVVFTAGLGIAGRTLFSERVDSLFGPLSWVISQGPQVALDAQIADVADGTLINWDVRADAFPPGMLEQMLTRYHQMLVTLAEQPDRLSDPVARWLQPPGSDKDAPVLQLLLVLARRMDPSVTPEAQDPVSANAYATLAGFINRYLPGVALTPEDACPDWQTLAALISQRVGDRADEMARHLLSILNKQP